MHKIIIGVVFNPHPAIYCISDSMRKSRSIWIISDLIAVLIYPGLCKNFTVSGLDISSYDISVLKFLPVIVAVIVKFYL